MNNNISIFLNISRWLAAFLVVIGHTRHLVLYDYKDVINKNLFIKGFYFVTGFGHEAVVVFFVISGYLVGALTWEKWISKGPSLREYFLARTSRIYTVLVPALLAGALLDFIGLHWFNASELYTDSIQYHTISLNGVISNSMDVATFFSNLFMLQGVLTGSFGSNNPLWSLSYEWWYYCIFALIAAASTTEIKKRQIVFITFTTIIAALLPFKIILWGSIWCLGFVAFKWTKLASFRPHPVLGVGFFLLALVVSRLSHNVENVEHAESMLVAFSRDFLLGVSFVVAVVSIGKMKKNIPFSKLHLGLANFSFSTYLFHFPFMLFIVATGFDVFGLAVQWQPTAIGLMYFVGLTSLIYIYCWGMSLLFERHTDKIRRRMSFVFYRKRSNQITV